MDISWMSKELMERLSCSYTVAQEVFGSLPEQATGNKQRKIRKWVEENYLLPEDDTIAEHLGKMTPTNEFIAIMKVCNESYQSFIVRKNEQFAALMQAFSEDVRYAFTTLFEQEYIADAIRCEDSYAIIHVQDCEGFVCKLMLTEATGIPEKAYDSLNFYDIQADGQGRYVLTGEGVFWEDDTTEPFTIGFAAASVAISCFRTDTSVVLYDHSFWNYLTQVAEQIRSKHFLPGDYQNEQEKALLPLLTEITQMRFRYATDLPVTDFSCIKGYFSKYGYTELTRMIDRMIALPEDSSKRQKMADKIIKCLSYKKYEPMCREIMALIQQSQMQYPEKISQYCDSDLLTEIRISIQRQMEEKGYSGQYPDYIKKGAIKGIRLVEAFDEIYFIGPEKNVAHHIHCTETYINGQLTVHFQCGTQCLRRKEEPGDAYSCMFRDQGRRLLCAAKYEIDKAKHIDEDEREKLSQILNIAVKQAERIKLTKEEWETLMGFPFPWGYLFWTFFLVGGGFFSVFMTLVFFVITILLTVVFTGFAMVPEVVIAVPWFRILLLTWILFGGIMGLVTVLAKRM